MMFIGIDIAKRSHAVCILDSEGRVKVKGLSISNTREGFTKLESVLQEISTEINIGLEATGHYWLALYSFLVERGYRVIVINPLQVSAYRKTGLRKVKTDPKDAFWIADFIRVFRCQASEANVPVILKLRELSRFRFRLNEQIGDSKNKLLSILDRVFPEYEQLFTSPFLQSSRQLLEKAVSAQEFADFDLQELTDLLHNASRGRFGQDKAIQIREQARSSVGVNFLVDAIHIEMDCLLAQIDLLEQQRQRVDAKLEELMGQIPDQYITSIPGIGLSTGAAILAEIGDVQRFDSVEGLVAYAGIDATVYQTGEFEAAEHHMSKRGSPYLRHALWQAASMAIRYDPQLGAYYHQKILQGKHHNVAIGAVCRKLLARIYVILKEKRPYVNY
jgi:transposase